MLLLSVVWESPCMKCLNPGEWPDLLLCVRISRAAAWRTDERRPLVDSRGRGEGDWEAIEVFLFYMRWYLVKRVQVVKVRRIENLGPNSYFKWGTREMSYGEMEDTQLVWYRDQERNGIRSAAERSVNYNNHHSVCSHQLLQDYFVPGTSLISLNHAATL